MRRIIILIFILLVISCTAIPEMTSPEAQLFSQKCSMCHSVPHPGRHTFEQWNHVVHRMEKEMKYKKMMPLTEGDKNSILGYLRKHAR